MGIIIVNLHFYLALTLFAFGIIGLAISIWMETKENWGKEFKDKIDKLPEFYRDRLKEGEGFPGEKYKGIKGELKKNFFKKIFKDWEYEEYYARINHRRDPKIDLLTQFKIAEKKVEEDKKKEERKKLKEKLSFWKCKK